MKWITDMLHALVRRRARPDQLVSLGHGRAKPRIVRGGRGQWMAEIWNDK